MRILLIYLLYLGNYIAISIIFYMILAALHVAVENPKVERVLDAILGFGGFIVAGIPTAKIVRSIRFFDPYIQSIPNIMAGSPQMPSPAARLWAMFLDTFAVLGLFLAFSRIYIAFGISGSGANIFAAVFSLLLYEPICVTLFKGTLGHYLKNFRVVTAAGGRVNPALALIRFIIKTSLGIFSFVLWFLGDRRAIHDIITRTRTEYRT